MTYRNYTKVNLQKQNGAINKMNDKFTKLLADNGWELKVDCVNCWIKAFLIETNGPSIEVPILLAFKIKILSFSVILSTGTL